jgi:hypothetical protein
MPKPPFRAKLEDKIFCPSVGREVSVDAYCHGWALRNELCKDAETCEPYLEYAERRLIELQATRRKIRIPPELFEALKDRAKAEGVSPEEFAAQAILKRVGR